MNDNMMEEKSGLDFSSFFVWKKLLSYRYANQNNYQSTKTKLNISFNPQKKLKFIYLELHEVNDNQLILKMAL